ncbi:short-chain dehydrogenase/reductase SDR [Caldithrix abyssi DSM 13497]|uniref:3-oxoacyl-(Acyl-carrier protein) reductase n=1 Tax=Caldithrix abyssi DSM 13497 TaxID=880073 RepID=H1XS57_CALAY|nr:SDR family oxidoreductase [Caldithrix abyssi]APF20160.1 3-oxoacyl-(acyl-carrier protein) reductase [Caldithrix abyssi DSM 13497]EHO40221.1 short-chain dehydrogenase/reductase SDR [Caldithrix abyssi DSM 13497]
MTRNILVTGISRGLGLEIAKLLLENDYIIWGVSRNITIELQNLMVEYPERLKYFEFDLIETKKVKNGIFNKFLRLDTPIYGFVNNAAIAYDDIVTNLNQDNLENMYRINVFSPMIMTKYVIRNMLLHNIKGSIVHVSSISVHTGYKGLAMYASTKGALEAFSKNLAREWGKKGIRSNCVVAGFMETEMSAKLDNEQKNRIYKRSSLKEPTSTYSVASTIEFLLSEKSQSITGQNIFVDSGTI